MDRKVKLFRSKRAASQTDQKLRANVEMAIFFFKL
jgi:hypothetical protein